MSLNRLEKIEDSWEKEPPETGGDSVIGRRVGIYELTKEIGRGGMGAVYLAERADGEFRQRVAVKLVKRGTDTDFVLNRFRHERQILASLEHPFIARLLDGGTTDDGLPYFVMDFIEGEPLTEFCEKNNLNLRERLELFLRVCEAVGFAHQKQIVHRDLKPSNILVTKTRMPKLLDFGIAKLLNPEEASETVMPTATQMRLMTAEYAAPEQISLEEITPATDVYSLGVLLYELVAGERPYKFPSRAPHIIARVICEEEVQSPKSKVQSPKNADEISDDLSNVILKSLQKKPLDRYLSVKEFSADIERFLKGKTVSAKPRRSIINPVQKTFFETAPTGGCSIAVLPLKFLGLPSDIETDDRFLSIGLTDALIARLSSVRRFILRPTSSVLRYSEIEIDSFTAGNELGVEFVVDGHIQKHGNRLRVSIQLLNVAGQATVWAERFTEKFTDVLDLEDAISTRVAESLIPRLTTDEIQHLAKRGTQNADAYEAYMRGRYFWNQFTPETFPKVLEMFQTAIALDPNYALAYVGVADFYNWASIFGIIPAPECYRQALVAARRALAIDDSVSEAHAALGFVIAFADNDWIEGERHLRRALELNRNNALAHEWLSTVMMGTGRIEEGLREIKRAESLDPLSLREKTLSAWTFYQARRFDDAIEKAKQLIEMDKNYWQGYLQLGNALTQVGRAAEAVDALHKAVRMVPDSGITLYTLCYALIADNQTGEAQRILNQLKTDAETRYVKPYFIGMACAALGERDEAFRWFNKSLDDKGGWLVWILTEAKLDFLRGDPRFNDLLRKTNRQPT